MNINTDFKQTPKYNMSIKSGFKKKPKYNMNINSCNKISFFGYFFEKKPICA